MRRHSRSGFIVILTVCVVMTASAAAQDVAIDEWLVIGPVASPLPAFDDEKPGSYGIVDLLEARALPIEVLNPRAEAIQGGFGDAALVWKRFQAGSDGKLALALPDGAAGDAPHTVWLASYLEAERFQALRLKLQGSHVRGAWIDGEQVTASAGEVDLGDALEGQLELVPGKHTLVVKTIFDRSGETDWWVSVSLAHKNDDQPIQGVLISTDPDRPMGILDIIDPPRVVSFATSPDGKSVATVIRRVVPGTNDAESWVEVRATESGKIVFSWRGLEMDQVAWAPDGDHITYVTTEEDEEKKLRSLWSVSFNSGRVTPVLERVEGLGSYRWSPTGKEIVYSVKVESESDERGVKRLESLLDRQAGHRDKSYLYSVSVPGGARRRLTAGPASTSAQDISVDGSRLLFTRRFDDPENRPYIRTELWELELATAKASKLRDSHWLRTAQYSPDGTRILILAGPTEFGDVGVNVPEGLTPNEYDGQLYVWDPSSDHVDALTVDFDPAVVQAEWSRKDGNIYLRAEQQDFKRLFRLSPKKKEVTRIPARFEALKHIDVADDAAVAVVTGSATWLPQGMARVDLKHDQTSLIFWPAGDWFNGTKRGTTETWTFTTSGGTKIDGRVYFPPDFDASHKYPLIVYYYGGTSPTSRDFGGRYPKEYWASSGYVVYVLQPSGATGYGQGFSAVHVNDWGEVVSDEIIEGVTKFIEGHSYVDAKRVGCIGASFGGFMSMTLVTKTDMFAAAVSHAGISSISSYWGEGYWGYSYSAAATADSFPWNRPDIYQARSPLANADKVKTPILLTHGRSDTNVPVGESDTFYTALKLVGAPVEYVQVEGQDHWILDHDKRVVWSDTIMAWFDRWLKDQGEWWEHLYPESE